MDNGHIPVQRQPHVLNPGATPLALDDVDFLDADDPESLIVELGDGRTMTLGEIIEAHERGELNEEELP